VAASLNRSGIRPWRAGQAKKARVRRRGVGDDKRAPLVIDRGRRREAVSWRRDGPAGPRRCTGLRLRWAAVGLAAGLKRGEG
jgi:hypothetical protein